MPVARNVESDGAGHRLSVTLNDEQYAKIAQIAQIALENRVSIVWVAREAVERLFVEDQPLLKFRKRPS